MRRVILQVVLLISCLLVLHGQAALAADKGKAADTVLIGGKIVTLNLKQPSAEAIAIRDGRVLALGTTDEMRKLGDADTEVIPLGGMMVLPGLIETHCHAIGVGRNSLVEPYAELSTIPEIQKWLKEKAKTTPKGRWITVPRTPITRLIERRHPTATELDAGCSTHPVVFTAARKSSLNSAAFAALGVKRGDTKLPGGTGKVIADADGQPWILIGGDAALRKFRPRREFSDEETLAALARVTRGYNEVGITSIFERASNAEGVRLFRELHKRGRLSVRS
nr:amidohydrolase family protein [Planctomycetota bacterium]